MNKYWNYWKSLKWFQKKILFTKTCYFWSEKLEWLFKRKVFGNKMNPFVKKGSGFNVGTAKFQIKSEIKNKYTHVSSRTSLICCLIRCLPESENIFQRLCQIYEHKRKDVFFYIYTYSSITLVHDRTKVTGKMNLIGTFKLGVVTTIETSPHK